MACYPLNVPLKAPLTIATGSIDAVRNIAIAVTLNSGIVDWGKAPTLPLVTHEDPEFALATARSEKAWLVGRRVDD